MSVVWIPFNQESLLLFARHGIHVLWYTQLPTMINLRSSLWSLAEKARDHDHSLAKQVTRISSASFVMSQSLIQLTLQL